MWLILLTVTSLLQLAACPLLFNLADCEPLAAAHYQCQLVVMYSIFPFVAKGFYNGGYVQIAATCE
jgi:hypothetical protein